MARPARIQCDAMIDRPSKYDCRHDICKTKVNKRPRGKLLIHSESIRVLHFISSDDLHTALGGVSANCVPSIQS